MRHRPLNDLECLRVGKEVVVLPLGYCGFIRSIRVDSSGNPLIDVELEGLEDNYVCRFSEIAIPVD
jgi:hypothetical protein